MAFLCALIASTIGYGTSACGALREGDSAAGRAREPAPPEVPEPMADFARLVGGEWWVTFASGERASNTWGWGPGKHSVRSPADGPDDSGLEVIYWHPGREQVCMFTMHGDIPGVGRGVGEGTLAFDGDTANGVFDLHQPRGLRKMGLRWVFDGPDKYHDYLLEEQGALGLQPMNHWERARSPASATALAPVVDSVRPAPAGLFRSLEALVADRWGAKGRWADGDDLDVELRFDWRPSLQAIYARALARDADSEPVHLLDAYVYLDVATDSLRCLALSSQGGVYTADAVALDDGELQLELSSYEADQVSSHVLRLDLEERGTLRSRLWSVHDGARTLKLEALGEKLESK